MSEKKPYLAMVLVQVIFAGMSMVAKAAFNDGMSTYVFVFYRQAISAVLFIPIALIFGRKSAPPCQFKLLMKIFGLALFGYTINVNLHSMAINYTTATVASAANNLTPVFAFVMAILLRMHGICESEERVRDDEDEWDSVVFGWRDVDRLLQGTEPKILHRSPPPPPYPPWDC